MTHRYSTRTRRPSGLAPGLAIAIAAGIALVGSGALDRRRARQRRRVALYPDSAPARTRRAPLEGRAAHVGQSVTINRPRTELYAFWRDFSNLPTFMSNIEQVRLDGPKRAVWTIAAPGGFTVDLASEVTEEREGELIAWRTVEGSDIRAQGRVSFRNAAPGRGTVVSAEVAYLPPGGEVGRWIAKLFQREPSIQGRRELKRFKMLMEAGEIATSSNRKND